MGDSERGIDIPSFFLCPISLDIMKDPVTLSTGITYDREAIEKWFCATKKRNCPITKQLDTDIELTPNHTLRRLIQSWCTLNAPLGVERFPTPRLPISKSQILKLLQDSMSSNLQMKSLKRVKMIVLESEMNKRSVEAFGAADYLVCIITNPNSNITSSLEAVSILYHLHLSQTSLKALFKKTEFAFFEALARLMRHDSNLESRTHAVSLLKSMIVVAEPIRIMSLDPQFFIELTHILVDKISQKATKAALKLLIGICQWRRNRIKAVEARVVPVLIDMLFDCNENRVLEMVLIVLDQLCLCAHGREEVLKHGAGLAVVSNKIVRVSPAASGRAVRILHSIAKFSGTTRVIQEMLQLGVVGKLCFMLQVGDCGSKTIEKAREILKEHAKVWKNSSCIPHHLVSCYP